MRKLLSILLTLLLLVTLALPALAEETEGETDVETSEESRPDDTPSAPDPEPDPAPDPEPGSDPSPGPAPAPDPESVPAPDPAPVPEPDAPAEPAPDLPEASPEASAPDIEDPPLDLDASGLPSGSGSLDAPTYDVTETPTGDIIIEEHSYTRTVDVSRFPAGFDLSDLTMRSALTAIFGEYQPKTQTVSTYYDGQLLDTSTEYVPGIAGMDMEWIAGVIIFTVLLFCLMKLLGGVFK